jgi:hypothetical protein
VLLELGLWRDLESFKKTGAADQPLVKLVEPKDRKSSLRALADDLPSKVGNIYGRLDVKAIDIDEHVSHGHPGVERVGRIAHMRIDSCGSRFIVNSLLCQLSYCFVRNDGRAVDALKSHLM